MEPALSRQFSFPSLSLCSSKGGMCLPMRQGSNNKQSLAQSSRPVNVFVSGKCACWVTPRCSAGERYNTIVPWLFACCLVEAVCSQTLQLFLYCPVKKKRSVYVNLLCVFFLFFLVFFLFSFWERWQSAFIFYVSKQGIVVFRMMFCVVLVVRCTIFIIIDILC